MSDRPYLVSALVESSCVSLVGWPTAEEYVMGALKRFTKLFGVYMPLHIVPFKELKVVGPHNIPRTTMPKYRQFLHFKQVNGDTYTFEGRELVVLDFREVPDVSYTLSPLAMRAYGRPMNLEDEMDKL